MRQIKFRAWLKSCQRMVDVVEIDFLEEYVVWIYDDYINQEQFFKEVSKFEDIILMQYTGLKDKNGIEIYEGDVLFHPLQGRRRVFYPFSETVASYGLRDIDNGFGSTLQDSHAVWEVIGNIYDNPELVAK